MTTRVRLALVAALAALAPALVASQADAQGMLIPTDTNLRPLVVKYQRVSAEIKDGAAVTRVEQVFVNESPRQLEAHYVFPLPKGAALSEFYLWINGKKTKGEMLEKQKATEIYEGIVRRMQDPGLLEYIDSDVFRARVFPVPANGEQKIELAFSQVLDFQSGLYHYRYPLGGGGKLQQNIKVKQDFTFSASIGSKIPLRSVYSPTHALQVANRGENAAIVGLEQGPGADLSKDLDLYYSTSEKAIGLSLMTYKEESEPGYFLALISPKTEFQQEEILGKRITFVIDNSGSMAGDRMKVAKDALKYCVQRLNPQDRFNVIRFATDVEALFPAPAEAKGDSLKKALSFVDGMEALGGTAIDDAMRLALKDGEKASGSNGPHIILFVTDGQPTIGETSEDAIAKNASAGNKAKSRVFTFGVGEDLNARLLDRLAADGQGAADYVKGGKDFEAKISGFYDKVSYPVLADVALDLSGMSAYDVYPRRLPDLFKGSQLVVMGRYRSAGDLKVTLTGTVNGVPKKFEYGTTTFAKEHKSEGFIPRLWAIRKVGYLLEEIRLRGEKPELRDEVVALGKKFGIVTPYTSYLVVEDTPIATGPRPQPPMEPQRFRPNWGADDRAASPSTGATASAPPPGAFAPRKKAEAAKDVDEDFDKVFGGNAVGSGGAPAPKPADVMAHAEGKAGIGVSKATRQMQTETRAPDSSQPVRVAGDRTYVWRDGGWIDTQALENAGKQLKVKYLSAAYFALLSARPDLKAGLALGNRVVLVVAKGKTVVIAPNEGEEAADKVNAFLK
ncbi:MAG TPA: VIT domain-containing protein [Myxococcales bacterium]|jgi:Ca-activated chloride channel family protein